MKFCNYVKQSSKDIPDYSCCENFEKQNLCCIVLSRAETSSLLIFSRDGGLSRDLFRTLSDIYDEEFMKKIVNDL